MGGGLGRNDCVSSFTCEVKGCDCRYHMRYTRGYESRCRDWAPLAALCVDKVPIQRDVLETLFGEGAFQKERGARFKLSRGISTSDGSRGEVVE